MAKKKSSNVVIKDEELTPTTLGVYSNKTKNPITLILLVAIFISVAIFMPNIQSYVNKMLGKSDTDANTYNNNGGSEGGGDVEPGDDEDENDKKYEIATTTTIDAKEYTLNNISLSGDTLSFSVYNKSNITLDLSTYYVELYNSEGTFISRIKVSNNKIQSKNSNEYSFVVPSSASTMSFLKKTSSDYPQVTLEYNDDMEATLVCTKGKKIYNYLFVDDQLTKIVHTYNLSTADDANYYSILQDYQNKAYNDNLVNGVTATVSDTISDFYFTMNIDLSTEGIELSKIEDDNLYQFKTEPREVKFIEEAQGFTCVQK